MNLKEVARELINGLDNDINEVITGLEKIMKDEDLTIEELREKCWEDSTAIFDKIYQ